MTGGHDLNKGAGGDYIYLYYTKESFANGRKVTKLLVDMNEEGAEGKNGNNNPADLNSGVSTGTRPYLHVTATQDRGFITDVMLISGGPNTITNLRNTYLEQGWWGLSVPLLYQGCFFTGTRHQQHQIPSCQF